MQRLSCLYLRLTIQFRHKAEFNLRIIIFKEFKAVIKVSFCVSTIQESLPDEYLLEEETVKF